MKALITGCVGFIGSHLVMSWVRIKKFIIELLRNNLKKPK